MIGLDTNVLVRYIAQDDVKQSAVATGLINSLTPESPGFVTTVALIELAWVMQSCYDASKADIVNILETLLRTRELMIEDAGTAIVALQRYAASKADFADCLIDCAAGRAGCSHTVTFDRNASRGAGMRLIG